MLGEGIQDELLILDTKPLFTVYLVCSRLASLIQSTIVKNLVAVGELELRSER